MRKLTYTIIMLITAFILGAVFGITQLTKPTLSMTPHHNAVNAIAVLQLTVYDKNGHLVYRYIHVDPPTANFLKWILLSLAQGENIKLVNATWIDVTGRTCSADISGFGVSSGAVPEIGLGDGTKPFSIFDHDLGHVIVKFPVTYFRFGANSTHMWIFFSGAITANKTMKITEIGLYADGCDGCGSNCGWFLLFRDVLPRPLILNDSQTLEVRYYIYVRYG